MLVAAVLAPHQREDGQLGVVGLAAHRVADALVFLLLEAEQLVGRFLPGGAHRFPAFAITALMIDSKTPRPSVPPTISSQTRSGCGIRPKTLRFTVADAGDVAERSVGIGLAA